jgi:lipopolysaccharide biosynthesis glycosyltransferase
MATLRLACAAEGAYDAHSAALLHSAAEHAGGLDLRVHYLHGPGFPRASADAIARMCDGLGVAIEFHPVAPELTAGLPVMSEFTTAMWYRIFLPELLAEADRILYLDVDTLVTDSLAPLLDIDLAGHYLGAVTNVFLDHHLHRPAELGLPLEGYFNSGVLFLNLDEMRRDDCTAALRDYAIENAGRIDWPDQDTLNAVLGGRRIALHPRWNAMNALRQPRATEVFGAGAVEEALRRPAIRHFEGPGYNKPWSYTASREAQRLYRRHRRATPWPRYTPEGRSVRSFLRRVRHRLAKLRP